MIFIRGIHRHALDVAERAGLKPHEWEYLWSPMQLVGQQQPNVVMLDTSWELDHEFDIQCQMNSRSATEWSELDLINGKVPK